jgi:hypothetical protein
LAAGSSALGRSGICTRRLAEDEELDEDEEDQGEGELAEEEAWSEAGWGGWLCILLLRVWKEEGEWVGGFFAGEMTSDLLWAACNFARDITQEEDWEMRLVCGQSTQVQASI